MSGLCALPGAGCTSDLSLLSQMSQLADVDLSEVALCTANGPQYQE